MMVRNESVGNILYKDALERRERSISKEQSKSKDRRGSVDKFVDKKSEGYILNKLKDEY